MSEYYGWENDAEEIWLRFFNRKLLECGILTQEEYGKIEAEITKDRLKKKSL